MDKFDIAVVGGGAAGLMAAITAGRAGASVALIERGERVGRKLLATGNGRCNLTNLNLSLSRYHGAYPRFAAAALTSFDTERTLSFFRSIGLVTREGEEGKIYPYSLQASSVLDLLRLEAGRRGAAELCGFNAAEIKRGDRGFIIRGGGGEGIAAAKVIVAAGGKAAPQLGTDGAAYKLLTTHGHKLTPLSPALVQLKSSNPALGALRGIKHIAAVSAVAGGRTVAEDFGEVLFTEYGLSGPPILQLSRAASAHPRCEIALDLAPDISKDELPGMLRSRAETLRDAPLEAFFAGFLNKSLGRELLRAAGIAGFGEASRALTDANIAALSALIKGWRFPVVGTMPWKNAQVTAGGMAVDSFRPDTLESLIAPGIYAAGEILDIDGDCGGFNLQWAWSSGFLAGQSAARAARAAKC